MGDQSRFERPPGPDRHSRRGRIFVLTLLAVALVVPLGVYETIPVKQHKTTAHHHQIRLLRRFMTCRRPYSRPSVN